MFKYIFTAVGLCTLFGALMDYNSTVSFLEDAVSVEGTVVALQESRSDGSATYKPVVAFVDGNGQTVEYISSVGSSPPSYDVGEIVEILYSPKNSQDAIINSFFELWGSVVIMTTMGVPFALVGAGIFLIGRLKSRKKDYLKRDGVVVDAQFQSVKLNHTLSVNGRNPYVIVCQWINPENYCVHIFESENLWFDPSHYINTEELKVFMDKKNHKKYYVDISFLPKVAS
jgi:hypothetical protein